MGINIGVFLTYVGVIILILLLGKLLVWPMKMVLKLVINSLIGGVVIFLINLVGGALGIAIPLNIVTALIVGFLGVPGAILLIILTLI